MPGNQVEKKDLKHKCSLDKNDYKVSKTADNFYGEYELWVGKDCGTGVLMVKTKVVQTEKEAKVEVTKILERQTHKDSSIQLLVDWSCDEISDWCSKHFNIKTYWTFSSERLVDCMTKCFETRSYFDHQELTILTYQILHA